MSQQYMLSVTIVTYNSGTFIRRCLESVLEQRHPHLEVIVVDNASTDGTTDILEHFEDRCMVVYNEENVGFAVATYGLASTFASLGAGKISDAVGME